MDGFRKHAVGLVAYALLLGTAQAGPPAPRLRVLAETDLGTYSEDVTYARTGPNSGLVHLIEGRRVYGYLLGSNDRVPVRLLFDLSYLGIQLNGLAYMESEGNYAVVSGSAPRRLMVVDSRGRLVADREIQYPTGYTPRHVEAVEYIAADSAVFPDNLALCAMSTENLQGGDILILRRDGSLVKQITLGGPCTAVAFRQPGHLLVSGNESTITTIDFDGHVVAGPTDPGLPSGSALEGLVSVPDGAVVAVGTGGVVRWLDATLAWQPELDRTFRVTQGVLATAGVTWDRTAGTLVLSGLAPTSALLRLTTSFGGVAKLADLLWPYRPHRLTSLPGDGVIAMAHRRHNAPGNPYFVPESIQFFNDTDGSHAGQTDLSPLGWGNPSGLAYFGQSGLFATSFVAATGPAEVGIVHLVSRAGVAVGTIDYSATVSAPIAALAVFPSETKLLFTAGDTLFVGDLDGNVTSQYSLADTLGMASVADLATITSGEYSDAFVAVGGSTPSRLIVFKLDEAKDKK